MKNKVLETSLMHANLHVEKWNHFNKQMPKNTNKPWSESPKLSEFTDKIKSPVGFINH